jgi:hypothetical protein
MIVLATALSPRAICRIHRRHVSQPLLALGVACYKYYFAASFPVGGIRIVVVRDLAKVEARVRFPYPAPNFPLFSTADAVVNSAPVC